MTMTTNTTTIAFTHIVGGSYFGSGGGWGHLYVANAAPCQHGDNGFVSGPTAATVVDPTLPAAVIARTGDGIDGGRLFMDDAWRYQPGEGWSDATLEWRAVRAVHRLLLGVAAQVVVPSEFLPPQMSRRRLDIWGTPGVPFVWRLLVADEYATTSPRKVRELCRAQEPGDIAAGLVALNLWIRPLDGSGCWDVGAVYALARRLRDGTAKSVDVLSLMTATYRQRMERFGAAWRRAEALEKRVESLRHNECRPQSECRAVLREQIKARSEANAYADAALSAAPYSALPGAGRRSSPGERYLDRDFAAARGDQ